MKFPLALLIPAFALLSCKQTKHHDEMHSSTVQLAKTTEAMNQNTSTLTNSAGDTLKVLNAIFDTGRQGAENTRRENFELALSARTMDNKLFYTRVYFYGFEFQLWTAEGIDSLPGYRDQLAEK